VSNGTAAVISAAARSRPNFRARVIGEIAHKARWIAASKGGNIGDDQWFY
jgi:hypothetical protein